LLGSDFGGSFQPDRGELDEPGLENFMASVGGNSWSGLRFGFWFGLGVALSNAVFG